MAEMFVAVALDAVVEDVEAPRPPIVPDERVCGDAVCDIPPASARIARSPPVGPVPLYGSAYTNQPCMLFGL